MKKNFYGIIFLFSAFLLAACQNPLGIDTPRLYVYDDSIRPGEFSAEKISFETRLNNNAQQLELVKNKFFCKLTDGAPMYLAIRVELQNNDLSAQPAANGIFFRADSLPVDNRFYSLSGDPTNLQLPSASKIIFLSNDKFFEKIPFRTGDANDNFLVKIERKNNKLIAEYRYSTSFDDGAGEKNFSLAGTFILSP